MSVNKIAFASKLQGRDKNRVLHKLSLNKTWVT